LPLLLAEWWSIPRKEDKTMTYTKPEVEVLGNASALIENIASKPDGTKDAVSTESVTGPSYDLDE